MLVVGTRTERRLGTIDVNDVGVVGAFEVEDQIEVAVVSQQGNVLAGGAGFAVFLGFGACVVGGG
jgi:hypothetical protein